MEENWLIYLRENAPELYQDAITSTAWDAEWRDKKIADLQARLSAAEAVAEAASLYIKHINSPLCVGWDDLLDALQEWRKAKEDATMKMIKISGALEIPDDMTTDEWMDKFIAWVEANGCTFGGCVKEAGE